LIACKENKDTTVFSSLFVLLFFGYHKSGFALKQSNIKKILIDKNQSIFLFYWKKTIIKYRGNLSYDLVSSLAERKISH
jgi:hypothetical protein